MAKIFSVNFNTGSVKDKFGATETLGSTAKVRVDEKGLALKCNNVASDYITYGDIAAINAIGTGEFSFAIGCNIKGFLNHGSVYNTLMGKSASLGTNGFAISYLGPTSLRCIIVVSNLDLTINLTNKNNLFIVTRNAAGLCTLYQNGVAVNTVSQAGDISTNAPLAIGYDGNTTGRTPNASIYSTEVYNHCLSTVEIQKLTAAFQNQVPMVENTKMEYIDSSDLSSQKSATLLASYNMKKQVNTLVDVSGNGKNATLTGYATGTKDGTLFSQTGYFQSTFAHPGTAYTISMRVLFNETVREQHLAAFGKGATNTQRYCVSSRLRMTGTTNSLIGLLALKSGVEYTVSFVFGNPGAAIYVDGVLDNSNVNYTEDQTGTYLRIADFAGASSSREFALNGEIKDIRVDNFAYTLTDAKNYHNTFARQIALKESFRYEPADGTSIVPNGWAVKTGAYKIGEISLVPGDRILNGGFDDATNWTITGESTISGGVARIYSSAGALSQVAQSGTARLIAGRRYRLKYDVVAIGTLGNGLISLNTAGSTSLVITTTGTNFIYEYTADTTATGFLMKRNSGAIDITFDNVSCEEIPALPTLPNGAKYIEATSNGIISIPSKSWAGTFEFDLYKGGDATINGVAIIDNTSGYNDVAGEYKLSMELDESLQFSASFVSAYFNTAASYIKINTWYRFRITRTPAGIFTAYIKGGLFGTANWTLISVAGGSGTNPVTASTYISSNYLNVSLYATDRFANLKITKGIEQ